MHNPSARRGVTIPGPVLLRSMAVAALAAGVAGCASTGAPGGPPPPATPSNSLTAPPRAVPPGVPAPAPSSPGRASNPLPTGAKYTIVCVGFSGPNHVQQARVSKENLIKATGRRDFYVVHDESQSTLYYGYYKERERAADAAEAARANADLEYLRTLGDAEGHRLFGASLIVPLPTPDPVAPPEFDLTRVDQDKSPDDPSRRYWSLAIADYSNDGRDEQGRDRKQIVVDAVKDARRRGIEAYYYNGPNSSTVCIGAWPRRAIREQETDRAETAGDTGQELLVSNQPLNKGLMKEIGESGRDIKVVQPRVVVDDPDMLRTIQQYKEYSLNGNVELVGVTDPKTGEKKKRPKDTFLVAIPRTKADNSLLANDRTNDRSDETVDNTAPAMRNPLDPTAGQNTGIGALRPQPR